MKNSIFSYIKIARPNHWIKQLFIIPGILISLFSINQNLNINLVYICMIGIFSTSLIASSNYVLNEYLDSKYDKYHPIKKKRPLVNQNLSIYIIIVEYLIFLLLGLFLASLISKYFLLLSFLFSFMGIIYNVKPIRTKDIPYLDVISESFNNCVRFLLGWFIITDKFLPPVSIVLGYWLAGAYLMSVKRLAELKLINNIEIASLYRKSFKVYTEKSLIISALFYSLLSIFFIGIFLIKYHIEYILAVPVLCTIFCYYFNLAYKLDSPTQKPEELYKEKYLIFLCLIFITMLIILTFIKIPFLEIFLNKDLLPIN